MLLQVGAWTRATGYAIASVLLGLVAAWVGMSAATRILVLKG